MARLKLLFCMIYRTDKLLSPLTLVYLPIFVLFDPVKPVYGNNTDKPLSPLLK